MHAFWKWLAVAGCGVGLLVAADRLRIVRADDEGGVYERTADGDSLDRLERIVEKLGRAVERMEHARPHGRPEHDRPPHHRPPHGPHRGPGMGPMGGEMPAEWRERVEKAREKFREMQQRIEKLEADVAALKAEK